MTAREAILQYESIKSVEDVVRPEAAIALKIRLLEDVMEMLKAEAGND